MFYRKEIFSICTLHDIWAKRPLYLGTRCSRVASFTSQSLYIWRRPPVYPLKQNTFGLKERYGQFWEENVLSPLPENERLFLVLLAHNLVNRPASTALFQLIIPHKLRPWKYVIYRVLGQKTVKKFLDVVLSLLAARYQQILRYHCLLY
jgi:hypothetical protein